MEDDARAFEALIAGNAQDLQALGLFFLRLLEADSRVVGMGSRPSSTLMTVFAREQEGGLGLNKGLVTLFEELRRTGLSTLTDGFGGSILRL